MAANDIVNIKINNTSSPDLNEQYRTLPTTAPQTTRLEVPPSMFANNQASPTHGMPGTRSARL